MKNEAGNAESLHTKGHGSGKQVKDDFQNNGTPKAALVSRADLEDAQVSTKATAALRSKLAGGNSDVVD